jgi:endonuclease G
MMIPNRLISETEQRYRRREGKRSVSLRRQDWKDSPLRANEKERIYKRLDRVELPHAFADLTPPSVLQVPRAAGAAMDFLGFERILGRSDLIGIKFLESGLNAARSVARVIIRDVERRIVGYGTGFLVSPRLMLTNNHVLETSHAASLAEIQFNYEDGIDGRMKPGRSFPLDPSTFFLTSVDLDYTLVAVGISPTEVSEFGFTRLIEDDGKVLVGEFVNIIQHPNGEPKQLAIRENQIVDLLENFLHYETDTAPGSSGSPVFNDQWEVVCLHHSGVPAMRDGKYLTVDDRIWTPDMGEQRIKWIANEGVRVSRITRDIKARAAGTAAVSLVDGIFKSPIPVREQVANANVTNGDGIAPSFQRDGNRAVWTFPLTVSVDLGIDAARAHGEPMPLSNGDAPRAQPPSVRSAPRTDDSVVGVAVEERVRSTADYADRAGYDPQFLDGSTTVPLPGLGPWSADAPSVSSESGDAQFVLRYTNFSVVMSASRRLPVVTAVNINGNELRSLPRRGDAWYFDPRIPREAQVGNELYASNPLDRGHMVRRLDPVWGPQAAMANEDTFHYTNACPQHANLNQRSWNDLENYILDNAGARGLRVCIFTGPVLLDDDPEYRGILIPREFWKIAALVDEETGELAASAYLLSQTAIIADLREFAFGQFRTYQVPISRIMRQTGLDFSFLMAADALGGASPRESSALQRPINGPSDIVFRRRVSSRRTNGGVEIAARA